MENLILYEKQKIVSTNNAQKIKITSPKDIYNLSQIKDIKDKIQENLIVIALNNKNIIDSIELVGVGSSKCIIIELSDVLRCALLRGSSKLIMVHNHPSGDSTPSKTDIEFINKLNSISKVIGINLLDHIIVGESNLSMREHNYIDEYYDVAKAENETILELKQINSKLIKKIERLERKQQKKIDELEL